MTVYVVEYGDFYDTGTIAGVYSTEALANDLLAKAWVQRYDWKSVTEHVVDQRSDVWPAS
jgi:hypothetical protein